MSQQPEQLPPAVMLPPFNLEIAPDCSFVRFSQQTSTNFMMGMVLTREQMTMLLNAWKNALQMHQQNQQLVADVMKQPKRNN